MHVSTRKGDGGSTDLLRGGRVSKHHQVIEVGGTLDEANGSKTLFIHPARWFVFRPTALPLMRGFMAGASPLRPSGCMLS